MSAILITCSPINVSSGYPFLHSFLLYFTASFSFSVSLLFSSCASRLSQALIDLASERSICAHRKCWERESDFGERKSKGKLREYMLESVMMFSGAASGWTEARVIMKGHVVRGLCTWHTAIYQGFFLLFPFHLQGIREIDDDVCGLLNMSIIMTTVLYYESRHWF